ncbi:MAG TPA: hypothetical protein VF501_00065 [Thiobacillus sp.]
MRVSAEQQQVIVDAVRQLFGGQGRVRLFGSRVDDWRKGGRSRPAGGSSPFAA